MSDPSDIARFGVLRRPNVSDVPRVTASDLVQPVQVVEVGRQAIEANVLRDGIRVGVGTLDPAVIGSIIDRIPTVIKVVSQSIAPGVAVAQGTAVDIVMTRTDLISLGVVQNIPEAMKQFDVSDAFGRFVQGRADVRRVLAQNADATTLTEADKAVINDVLAQNGINLTGSPGDDVDAAFTALQAIHTFGG